MLVYLNQDFYRNIAALIGIVIVIGHCCQCVLGNLGDAIPFVNNNNLENVELKEYSNQMHSDLYTPPNAAGDGENPSDINVDVEEVLEPETASFYLNVSEFPGELCNRVCASGQQRVCYFEFTLEHYQAMGAACGRCAQGVEEECNNPQCIVGDGVEKGVMSINRQVPGPAIQVCKDDLIIVDVRNHAYGSAASLHWHGIHMEETPYMDGVPFVTQCPIPFANTFRYQFYATQAGTQFYHSHAGHHKVNGQYGALIVRQPEESSNHLYDYDLPEHYILISDWMHAYAEQDYPGRPSNGGISPDSVLINGRGVYTNPKTKEQSKVRPLIYYVTSGKRYRFRLINAVSHACPFQIQVEKHNLIIIASDSYDVIPQPFDTLVSNSGERYDFILEANHTNGDFWIRVRGLGICEIKSIESYALLKYKSSDDDSQIRPFPKYEDQYQSGTFLNHPNATCLYEDNDVCVSKLKAAEEDEDLRTTIPEHQFFLAFNNYPVPNKEIFEPGQYHHFINPQPNLTLVGAINNFSFVFPDYPPLTQPELVNDTQFCDDFDWPAKCVGRNLCSCTHRLKVKLNSIVEMIVIDESQSVGQMHHPFHLHGYQFMVTDLGQHPLGLPMTVQLAKQMQRLRKLPRESLNTKPPFKDTVSIPSSGYAIIRFRAANPGFWLLHCHYEWHMSIGMGLVLQVGETSQMVKAPNDFPKCGNYLPPVLSPQF